ncbi:MAG: DNA-3-methyladenine glycosylase 2 family protein [Clostridia bacterium]|nr:DNA-3-methyladenine glycosylase 2 family protein [Clostridia bacterium]
MKFKNSFYIDKTEIDFLQTLSCGQIFSYKQTDDGFLVFSGKHFAKITENQKNFLVEIDDEEYFKNFFDLETNYLQIKTDLLKYPVLEKPIAFGSGIRILRQDLLETIISFVISANNNIKRITNSVFFLRENFGEKIGEFYAFPTLEKLACLTEEDFRRAGAGYRSVQLVKLISQLSSKEFLTWGALPTEALKAKLVALSGVGPKVADCIMLFGYGKPDVFPVDTWIEKVYNQYFQPCKDRVKIRRELVDKFKNLSGYAQQYLFFYQRNQKI